MPQKVHTVRDLAVRAGVSPHTVRFYDRAGLLGSVRRSRAGYRLFTDEAIDRIRFVRRAQGVGLKLADIRTVLAAADHGRAPCGEVRRFLLQRLAEIEGRLAGLHALRRELRRLLRTPAAAGRVCGIIERASLASHTPMGIRQDERAGTVRTGGTGNAR